MWNKIKKFGYLVSARYIFLGTILSVLVFQFVTTSLTNSTFEFNSLIDWKTIILVISGIVGVSTGGLLQILISIYDKNKEQNDHKQWLLLKEKSRAKILSVYLLGFSIGGLVGMLTKKILETNIDNEFFQTLFSNENIIDFIGVILAAAVFGLLYTLGTTKRLRLLYGN